MSRTCLRCENRIAKTRAESFDPHAGTCQCVLPVPSLDGRTLEGHGGTMKQLRDWEYRKALQAVLSGLTLHLRGARQ